MVFICFLNELFDDISRVENLADFACLYGLNRVSFGERDGLQECLNMAARISDSGALSFQNMAEIELIDEDELPIANIVEHKESDDGLDSDFEEEEEEEEEIC